ncbi:MAG: hypothetical protein QG608_2309 [Actinomycetota bacterium]|nr:hypothetical protein [Actinomycetota bacterium]
MDQFDSAVDIPVRCEAARPPRGVGATYRRPSPLPGQDPGKTPQGTCPGSTPQRLTVLDHTQAEAPYGPAARTRNR